ncbi:BrnT family toxin, partial [Salmonella enterica subsp. enterica serovar Derby]|nr:BrnT family toxin [Salmonella enterica subsp. enterica serovar Derby]
VLVAHTTRFEDGTEIIRLISARKAEKNERRRYEHG